MDDTATRLREVDEECDNCRFFFQRDEDVFGIFGGCRRHAPKILDVRDFAPVWPKVYVSDWCGDWETRCG